MYTRRFYLLIFILLFSGVYLNLTAATPLDESAGVIDNGNDYTTFQKVELPRDFDPQNARIELRRARKNKNTELAGEISLQLHTWWLENRDLTLDPAEHGSNPDPGPQYKGETREPENGGFSEWGNDVRIAPESGTYDVEVASLSNGELYTICVWDSSGNDHILMHRSTDDGLTWSRYWNFSLTDYNFYSPGIIVHNDTLVTWYILENSSGDRRNWFRVLNPGPIDDPIYWGSPSGGFNPVEYNNLHACTDAAVYGTYEYVYATWSEEHGTGPDSTRVMVAISWDNDLGSWEEGPIRVRKSSGSNIYYTGTRIAFGSTTDVMWLVAWLHPSSYPTTFDRVVRGWKSEDYGSTWGNYVNISSINNGYDETEHSIAGSHINQNWVLLCESIDTGYVEDVDIYNYYSTNDTNWTRGLWVTNDYENILPDVWVDDGSNAFWAVLRQDRSASGEEHVRVKIGDINNPASWNQSYRINDDPTDNLSGAYGPSVDYNSAEDTLIVAWNSFEGYTYSIWFDGANWTGIEEDLSPTSPLRLSNNPTHGKTDIFFSIENAGNVRITLHDVSGRMIKSVFSGRENPGQHSISFDPAGIPSGIYFLRLETPSSAHTRKMTLVR